MFTTTTRLDRITVLLINNVVSGGTSSGEDSQSSRKRHTRTFRVPYNSRVVSIQLTDPIPLDLLTFSSNDLQDIHLLHDDPLVVTLTIINYLVKRVLIDTGSSSDILFAEAFNQL